VFTHASWSERRSDSYERLAFLGDSVLSLSVTAYLYPRFEAERYGAGRLTKIRAQAVSGRACKEVAEELGLPERLQAAAPASAPTAALTRTERVLASVLEAVIGACYLAFGFEPTAKAVVEAFREQVEEALEHPEDSKSALQELLARRGDTVDYTVTDEAGPPHDRTFEVAATVSGDVAGLWAQQEGRGAGGRSRRPARPGVVTACT
jgi:ribonuclease III